VVLIKTIFVVITAVLWLLLILVCIIVGTTTSQWSFGKTGTMGTLARQAEIDVWVQAPGRSRRSGGITVTPVKILRFYVQTPAV